MSGALEVPATKPQAAPPVAAPAKAPASIPPPPKPAQGLNIVLKPGLQHQADLPETGGTTAGGSAPPTSDAPIGVDAEAQQAAAEMMQSAQAQPDTIAGTKEAKAPAATAAEPAARTLRDVLTEEPTTGQAAVAGAKPAEGAPTTIAGDLATTLMESPKAIVGGVRNASEELLDSTKSVADWLTKNVGDLGGAQVFDVNGNFDPKIFPTMAEAEAQGAVAKPGKILPTVGAPRSVGGNVISNITQFLTGMAVGGKVLGAYAESAKVGKVASGFIKAAFSDAFAFDPAQERLSNLLHDDAGLREPVTEFLRSKPGDSEAEGRLKNALEGLGIGAALQVAFVAGLRGMKAARTLGHAAEPVDPKALARALSPLGDSAATGPIVAATPAARDAKAAMTAAEAATRKVRPQDIARGKGLTAFHGTPHEVDRFDTSRIGSGEGAQAYGHGLYFAESADIARAYREQLAGQGEVFIDGKRVGLGAWNTTTEQIVTEMLLAGGSGGDMKVAIAEMLSRATRRSGADAKTYRDAAEWLKQNQSRVEVRYNPGNVYQVAIDADHGSLLDWDEALSDQSPAIKAAMSRLHGMFDKAQMGKYADATGREAYLRLLRGVDGPATPELVSAALRKVGIKGIRYLDAGSRGDGAQNITRNIVVFDDKDIKITGRMTADGKIEPVSGIPSSVLHPHVSINFARIETADDVKAAMQQAANIFGSDIEKAQRGVISLAETKNLADGLGMQVDDLLSRRRANNGARTPFTAEEAVAARRLLTAAGEKLLELARTAASPNAGEVDQFNFRKMMATHYAIQQEVLGARTETARALSSWRIGAGSSEAQIKAIQAAMEAGGGSKTTKEMATALAMLDANTTTPGAVAQAVRQGVAGKTIDAIREAYTGGLLSNFPTHIVNFLGNIMAAGQQVYERKAASAIGRALGTENGVGQHEAGAMAFAFMHSQVDAFRMAWKTLRTGETTDLLGRIDLPHQNAISAETWGLRNNSIGGRTVDLLGRMFRTPMLLMSSTDQYFKTINYRMELAARASSQAVSEGLQGKALTQRISALMTTPPEDLKIAAADQALYATFNNSMGWFGKAAMSIREGGGALNPSWMIMPFIRTPVNLARYAFERTPLAPLVGQWRADIAAGGRARDIALSKMTTGTIIMGIVQSMAESGYITGKGPTEPGERANWLREGHQSYSFRFGDHWVSYSRDSTFGTIAGFAADMQDTLGRGDVAPGKVDEWNEVMAGGIAAVSNTTLDKTFLSGAAGFIDMMSDPSRYAPSEIDRQVASFLPFTGLAGGVTRATDQTVRDVRDPWQAIQAKIPGLAAQLIPRRDLWGRPVSRESGLGTTYDVLSPFQVTDAKASPIDAELERLRAFPQAIGWKTSVNGVAIDFSDYPQTLDRYRALAGNEWKHPAWGMGLKDFLDATVQGKGPLSTVYQMYSDGEQGGKQAFIRSWIQKYREGAAQALLADPKYAQFKAYWDEQKAAQRALSQKVNVQ